MFNNIEEALDNLMSRGNNKKIISSDEKMRRVFARLGYPEANLEIIHVAGTNGKGSTVNYIRSILEQAGYRVGTFTSPHLTTHNDRIRINNIPISDDHLLQIINETYPMWEEFNLGMFEIDVLISIIYFSHLDPDFVIFETGIGGTYDATNAITPILSVITNVGMDHMNLLGDTLPEIAEQKAGIIKMHTPVVTTEYKDEVLDVFKKRCELMEAELNIVPIPDDVEHLHNDLLFTYRGERFVLPTKAPYQAKNAALAIETCNIMRSMGYPIDIEVMKSGLAVAVWPGRFHEVLPNVYLDGAHNLPGIEAMIEAFPHIQKPISIVFAALGDKETSKMLELITNQTKDITVTEFAFYRAATAESIAKDKYLVEKNYELAIENGVAKVKENGGSLVVTGSLYFISEAYKYLLGMAEKSQNEGDK